MNNELSRTKIDERIGIEYRLEGDYYIPNLIMPKQEKIILNKYGRMRLNYLKEHKKAEYSIMLWRYIEYSFKRNSRNCNNKSWTNY